MKKEEQIREAVRKVINQMIDEEYDSLMKEIEAGTVKLTTRSVTEIIDQLLSPNTTFKKEESGESNSGN